MKLKKALGIVVAVAMFGILALTSSAVVFGFIENDDVYWRIEIYNEWGSTGVGDIDVPAGQNLSIAFTLSGMPDGAYTAYLGTSADWKFKDGSDFSVPVNGDGTYTITASWDGDVNAGQVFVIDIGPGLPAALGISEAGETGGVTATATYTVGGEVAPLPITSDMLRDMDGGAKAGVGDAAVASAIALAAAGAVIFARKKR
ncbi:MAG: hypothetical protein LBC86_04550 [Oscillospiraceae bacterium]|nr:hypothetical protein [Oscillospiraceae bacterium]